MRKNYSAQIASYLSASLKQEEEKEEKELINDNNGQFVFDICLFSSTRLLKISSYEIKREKLAEQLVNQSDKSFLDHFCLMAILHKQNKIDRISHLMLVKRMDSVR